MCARRSGFGALGPCPRGLVWRRGPRCRLRCGPALPSSTAGRLVCVGRGEGRGTYFPGFGAEVVFWWGQLGVGGLFARGSEGEGEGEGEIRTGNVVLALAVAG